MPPPPPVSTYPPSPPASTYRLVRRPTLSREGPRLDAAQRDVVEHPGGPLLVLAGPGTGKTTTIVESVVHRVCQRGVDPAQALVLTFSRRAAAELRTRIAARLRRTTREPLALTFHSYAFALLRQEALSSGAPVPRLLSGPEHDLEIRRLLRGEVDDGAIGWPPRLRPALLTRGFAQELRDLLLRAQERGLDHEALAALGHAHGRDDWIAAGGFLRRYLERFAVDRSGPVLDYAELVSRAADLLADRSVADVQWAARPHVFVDEYQDTDPAQERLLQALAGGGRDLVVVGDPDQSIYAFRGADVGTIARFPEQFRTVDGAAAPVVALRTARRSGAGLLAASRRIAGRLPVAGTNGSHRDLVPAPGLPPGTAEVRLAGSTAAEAALIADVLRRAHVVDGMPWAEMAVLLRSASRFLPALRRALAAVGVPHAVAGTETPLVGEPAVRPFLLLLRCALRPESLDEAAAEELLSGPLGEADALDLRRLRRALLAIAEVADVAAGAEHGGPLAAALRDPRDVIGVPRHLAGPVQRVAGLLRRAAEVAASGGTAEDVLWSAWSASGLSSRWERASAVSGPTGDAADRALDAMMALFDAAARFADRLPGAGPALFLDDILGREIAGDTLAEHAPRGDVVRLLTAHRSKGLEWDLVVVAGVQEGSWPDLRRRGSLLGSEELADVVASGQPVGTATTAAELAEERRLFYVAVTRARHRLVVTAVGGTEEETEERPSRFLTELRPPEVVAASVSKAARPLSLSALVAELRSVVTSPSADPALRRAAASRLATLASAGVPGAAPSEWQVLTSLSTTEPVTRPGSDVVVSPSQVEAVVRCPLRWLLERAVGAAGPPGPSQAVGTVIHALAALVADPNLTDEAELVRRLDAVWSRLDLGSRWHARAQRDLAVNSLRKFLAWHASNNRTLVAVEAPFTVRSGRAVLRGRVDRLERDAAGHGVVVDLKTGSSKPTREELARQPQLGVYQLATARGGFAGHGVVKSGGAELLQIGKCALTNSARSQAQPALSEGDGDWVAHLLDEVTEEMAAATFRVTVNDSCRTCAARMSCPLQPEGQRVTA